MKPHEVADSDLRGLWRVLDKDCSGEVDIEEFMSFMRREEKELPRVELTADEERGAEMKAEAARRSLESRQLAERRLSGSVGLEEQQYATGRVIENKRPSTHEEHELLLPLEQVRAVVLRLNGHLQRVSAAWDTKGSMNKNWEILFKKLDADFSGRLDYAEFVKAVKDELRVPDTMDDKLHALWTYVDQDRSGEVTIGEFQHGCYLLILEGWPVLKQKILQKHVDVLNRAAKTWQGGAFSWYKVFKAMDTDENDRLGYEELERVVRMNATQGGLSLKPNELADSALRGLWRALDEDSSGEVTIDEFMKFMRREEEKAPEIIVEKKNPRVLAAREKAKLRVEERNSAKKRAAMPDPLEAERRKVSEAKAAEARLRAKRRASPSRGRRRRPPSPDPSLETVHNFDGQLRAILRDMEAWDRPQAPLLVKKRRGLERPTFFGSGLRFEPPSTPRLQKLRPITAKPKMKLSSTTIRRKKRKPTKTDRSTANIYSSTIDLGEVARPKKLVRPSTCDVRSPRERLQDESADLLERTSVYGHKPTVVLSAAQQQRKRPRTEHAKRPSLVLSEPEEEENPFARERHPSLVSPAKASGRQMRAGRIGGDLTPQQQRRSFGSTPSFDDELMDDESYEKYVSKVRTRDGLRTPDDYGDALAAAGVYDDEGDDATTSNEALEVYLKRIFQSVDVNQDGEISTQEAIQAVRRDDEFAAMLGFEGSASVVGDGEEDQLEFAIGVLDADGNQRVSWSEFRVAFLGPVLEVDPFAAYLDDYETYLRAVFEQADANADGELSYAELVSALKDPTFAEVAVDAMGFIESGVSREEFADQFLDACDWDGSDSMEWAEFRDAALASALDMMHAARMEHALREVFDRVQGGDGAITIEDAVAGLREDSDFAEILGFYTTHLANDQDGSLDYLIDQLQALDTNGDGVIDYSEFRGLVFPPEPSAMDVYLRDYEAYLCALFERVDVDGSGTLSFAELAAALRDEDIADAVGLTGSGLTSLEFADRLLASLDWDGDQEVSWEEFKEPALHAALKAFAKTRLEMHLKVIFDRVDVDGSGAVSIAEAVVALRDDDEFATLLGFEGATALTSEDDVDRVALVLAALDESGDEHMSWGELRRAVLCEPVQVEDPFAEDLRAYEGYLREVFDRVDANMDGELSYAELVAGLKDPDFTEESGFYDSGGLSRGEFAEQFCDALDWDGDRHVQWDEFRDAALESALDAMHEARLDAHLRRVFDAVDAEGKDYITLDDAVAALRDDAGFAEVLGFYGMHHANDEDGSLDALCAGLAAMDVNRDGVVSWAEFRYAALGGAAPVEAAVEVEAEVEVESPVDAAEEPPAEPDAEPNVKPPAEPDAELNVEQLAEPDAEASVEPPVEPTVAPPADPTVALPVEPPAEEETAEATPEPTILAEENPEASSSEPTAEPTAEPTIEPEAAAAAAPVELPVEAEEPTLPDEAELAEAISASAAEIAAEAVALPDIEPATAEAPEPIPEPEAPVAPAVVPELEEPEEPEEPVPKPEAPDLEISTAAAPLELPVEAPSPSRSPSRAVAEAPEPVPESPVPESPVPEEPARVFDAASEAGAGDDFEVSLSRPASPRGLVEAPVPAPVRTFPIVIEGALNSRACAIKCTRTEAALTCDVLPADTGKPAQLTICKDDLDWDHKALAGKDWHADAYAVGRVLVGHLVLQGKGRFTRLKCPLVKVRVQQAQPASNLKAAPPASAPALAPAHELLVPLSFAPALPPPRDLIREAPVGPSPRLASLFAAPAAAPPLGLPVLAPAPARAPAVVSVPEAPAPEPVAAAGPASAIAETVDLSPEEPIATEESPARPTADAEASGRESPAPDAGPAAPEYFPTAEGPAEPAAPAPMPAGLAEVPAADVNAIALEGYLRQVFDRVDTGGDGEISIVEAIKALRTDDEFAELLGFDEATRVKASDGSKDRLTLALAALDSDGDKLVSWEEFRRAALGETADEAPVVVIEAVEPAAEEAAAPRPSTPEPTVAADPALFTPRPSTPDPTVPADPTLFTPVPAETAVEPDANVAALEAYLRQVFECVDASGDGHISVEEAVGALRDDEDFSEILGVESSRDDILEDIRGIDADGDSRISWSEFRRAALGEAEEAVAEVSAAAEPAEVEPSSNAAALETYLKEIFDRVDAGGDGEISVVEAIKALRTDDEFAEILGFEEATRVKASDGSKDRLTLALAALDSDGDKMVSWDEFKRAALGEAAEDAPEPVVIVDPAAAVELAPAESPIETPRDEPTAEPTPDANVTALVSYLRGIFDRVDADGSGSIPVQEAVDALREDDEFAEVLGVDGRSKEEVLATMAAIDADGDSRVSFDEFRRAALGEETGVSVAAEPVELPVLSNEAAPEPAVPAEPAVDPAPDAAAAEALAEPSAEPVEATAAPPAAEEAAATKAEPVAEEAAEAPAEPAVEPGAEPVAEPAREELAAAEAEPLPVEPVSEPAAPNHLPGFAPAKQLRATASSTAEPAAEPAPEPDEPAPEPAEEPAPEPAEEPTQEPTANPEDPAELYWLARREAEGDAPVSNARLCTVHARRAFAAESPPEMALDAGDRVLVLADEHAAGEGWIFATKDRVAGYVPRNYLVRDPAAAVLTTDSDSTPAEPLVLVTEPRSESPPHPLVPPLSPIAGSPPDTAPERAQSPTSPSNLGALEDYLWTIFDRVASSDSEISIAEAVRALRDDEGFAEVLGFDGPVRGDASQATEFRNDIALALEALDTDGNGLVSWAEFRRAALGGDDEEAEREQRLTDENAELKRRLAAADGGLEQRWGSMAGGDDDDSYSSRSYSSRSTRSSRDSLYDEFN